MSPSRRCCFIGTSVVFLLILAGFLLFSLEVRAPPTNVIPVARAQAVQVPQEYDRDITKGKAKINGSDFDRASIYPAPTVYLEDESTPVTQTTPSATTHTSMPYEGMIGLRKGCSSTSSGSSYELSSTRVSPAPSAKGAQLLVMALTYAGSSGPTHCRGNLIAKFMFSDSIPTYRNGTCVTLPTMARCGVFLASKEAGCQVNLFDSDGCLNKTTTYLNTVVFMPEERPVGAYWKSMWIRCGVEASEAKILDPSLLEGLLKDSRD
ncbi:hypothetical protein M011DRAFT_496064 [Sporormia fimetaria CBS 119925]|uniref:Uncharacterized protein n=1 Tax=Sporormia fimetaria CBS 119925 TaxID=1340428 RepID=A0A6A6V510_9PLEO|nr:hypothetical protein M011DRAFT_496064 [Sporormia fimetaria CBS 119925]